MDKAVRRYRQRRKLRLDARGFRLDEDDEEWRTTDSGQKILIEDGIVVGGNPFVRASMGKPEGKEIPKKSVKLSSDTSIHSFINKLKPDERKNLAESIKNGKDKNCIFGGFYKVGTSGGSLKTADFFNPFTGESFSATISDKEDARMEDDPLCDVLSKIPENEDAKWAYNRSNGIVQKGDTVRVVKGRTLEHGTEAKVREIYPMKDRYGRYVADYAYLDNGEKINVTNVSIVEDGKLIQSKADKEHEETKAAHKEYKEASKARSAVVSKEAIQTAVGDAKTQKSIATALKKAGYKFEDSTADSGYPNFRISNPDGGYARVYVKKTGRKSEVIVQSWEKPKEEKIRPDYEIEGAKRSVRSFLRNLERTPGRKFEDMDPGTQYAFVLAKTASFFLNQGMESKKAWSRAIGNARAWADKDFAGYNETSELEDQVKDILKGYIEALKK